MHTLSLGPSIVIISSACCARRYSKEFQIVDYLDTTCSVNGYDNTLVSPPAFMWMGKGQASPLPHTRRYGGASAPIGPGSGAEPQPLCNFHTF